MVKDSTPNRIFCNDDTYMKGKPGGYRHQSELTHCVLEAVP